jgi:hypothetical protein
MSANSFESPISKADYIHTFGSIPQVWSNSDRDLEISLLHCLLSAFLRFGNYEIPEQLVSAFPDDLLVRLAHEYLSENWKDIGIILSAISLGFIQEDNQLFNELIYQVFVNFTKGELTEESLSGVLHVLVNSNSPDPVHLGLIAIYYCLYLVKNSDYEAAMNQSGSSIRVIEKFRDIIAYRKIAIIL